MTDLLEESRNYWDRHAQRDPLWAILSDGAKRDGKWDASRFFETGVSEIAALFYELHAQGVALGRGSALDFGSGVGRLTQALAPHFDRVVGVDVSPCMVELASRLNRFPPTVSYVCNLAPDLAAFDDNVFDFIVSSIVLQHIPPEVALEYLREFLRVLRPAGIVVFQLPSHPRRPESRPPASVVRPMLDDAYRASLAFADEPPGAMAPADHAMLELRVTNRSTLDWSSAEFGVISLGNHWFEGAGGRMVMRDDGRTNLPGNLRAGETCRVLLTIKAPPKPGEYTCEVDLAHEGVAWFQERGSGVVRFGVHVGPPDGMDRLADPMSRSPQVRLATSVKASGDRAVDVAAVTGANVRVEDPGEFPMYAVPLRSVVALIADRGVTLLHVENDRSCGDDWVSYRYFVRK